VIPLLFVLVATNPTFTARIGPEASASSDNIENADGSMILERKRRGREYIKTPPSPFTEALDYARQFMH